jgi:hypothetical protein
MVVVHFIGSYYGVEGFPDERLVNVAKFYELTLGKLAKAGIHKVKFLLGREGQEKFVFAYVCKNIDVKDIIVLMNPPNSGGKSSKDFQSNARLASQKVGAGRVIYFDQDESNFPLFSYGHISIWPATWSYVANVDQDGKPAKSERKITAPLDPLELADLVIQILNGEKPSHVS